MKIIDSLRQYIDQGKTIVKGKQDGKLIIIIGNKGTGKSETIKHLFKGLSGHKFIMIPDANLNPQQFHLDDKNGYEKIPNCFIIEDDHVEWQPGLFILEDYPLLNQGAQSELYNIIKDARHSGINIIIVAHQYSALNKQIFDFANYILLYRNAVITPHQLSPRVGGLGNGHAIVRAIKELLEHHYYIISCNDHKWNGTPLNSRDKTVLHKAIKGWLKETDLTDIHYLGVTQRTSTKTERTTKQQVIEAMITQDKSNDEILEQVKQQFKKGTSVEYIWKVKCKMRKKYRRKHNLPKNIPETTYPSYLRDKRTK